MRIYFLILGLSLLIFACDRMNHKEDVIIARAGTSQLYLSELKNNTPNNLSKNDSASFARSFIDQWIKNQLLLEKAELNLNEDIELERQMNNYRTYLLINKYQKTLLKQKLDTLITFEDIEEYYSEHAGDFRLSNNIIKVNYIKLPIATYDAHKVRRWYRSDNEEDINDLEDYCYQNAHEFEFSDEWIKFDDFLNIVPLRVTDQVNFLHRNSFIEITDSLYRYFVRIKDYKIVNDTSPIQVIDQELKSVILNKRKIQFLKELENNIYQDALDKNKIEIFTN